MFVKSLGVFSSFSFKHFWFRFFCFKGRKVISLNVQNSLEFRGMAVLSTQAL